MTRSADAPGLKASARDLDAAVPDAASARTDLTDDDDDASFP